VASIYVSFWFFYLLCNTAAAGHQRFLHAGSKVPAVRSQPDHEQSHDAGNIIVVTFVSSSVAAVLLFLHHAHPDTWLQNRQDPRSAVASTSWPRSPHVLRAHAGRQHAPLLPGRHCQHHWHIPSRADHRCQRHVRVPKFLFFVSFHFLIVFFVLFRFIFVWFFYCCSTRVFRYIEATHIEQTKKSYDQMEIEDSAALELTKEPDCYTILASTIAPEIYGHLDVKQSLLLQVKARLFFWGSKTNVADVRCSLWEARIET